MGDFDLTRITEDWDTVASPEQLEAAAIRYGLCAKLSAGKRFLEVGCGRGAGLDYVARTASAASGIDAMAGNIDRCKEQGVNADLRVGDATELPYDDDAFDVAACLEVMYYINDQQKAIDEMARVVAPGGHVLIVSANPERQRFHESPGATTYPTATDLSTMLSAASCSVEFYGAFPFVDSQETTLSRGLELIRRAASALHLIPTTIEGRGKLKKRIYRSNAKQISDFTDLQVDPWSKLTKIDDPTNADFTVMYALATVARHSAVR